MANSYQVMSLRKMYTGVLCTFLEISLLNLKWFQIRKKKINGTQRTYHNDHEVKEDFFKHDIKIAIEKEKKLISLLHQNYIKKMTSCRAGGRSYLKLLNWQKRPIPSRQSSWEAVRKEQTTRSTNMWERFKWALHKGRTSLVAQMV